MTGPDHSQSQNRLTSRIELLKTRIIRPAMDALPFVLADPAACRMVSRRGHTEEHECPTKDTDLVEIVQQGVNMKAVFPG